MNFSHKAKEAIKTALAMTIAYGISLQMGWDRPYWAGFAIAFISLATVGQSLNKGVLRMAGTLVAAIVALTLIALFAQQRWLLIFFISLWFALCTYMNTGNRHQYFWFVAAFVSLIICADAGPYPGGAFATAVLRVQQTGLGILVYSLVAILLWPNNSQRDFENTAIALAGKQRKLFSASLALLKKSDGDDSVQSLREEEIATNTQLGVLLDAAASDSYEVQEMEQYWRRYQSAVGALAETMQQLRENYGQLPPQPLPPLLPGLDAFADEMDRRLGAVETMLGGNATQHRCGDSSLQSDPASLDGLSHFHRAALLAAQRQLLQIDTLTRNLFKVISTIRGYSAETSNPPHTPEPQYAFTPDPERLLAAGKMMGTLWLAFLAVIYIGDFPGGFGFVSMVGPIGMVLVSNPQTPVALLFAPVTVGILFASVLYIFVMPQLSSFVGLGLMIFAATFVICYRYASPQQGLGRAFGLAMFVTLISVSNQQSYNFLSVANTALMFPLLFLLLAIVAYIPFSPLPERALLRLLKRYFHSAEFLLAQNQPTAQASLSGRFHRQEVASLPAKMEAWAKHADPGVLGESSTQQLPALLCGLQALTYRLQALQEARELPQSAQLRAALEDDMQNWRQKFINALQHLADDPTATEMLNRTDLDQHLAQLELRVKHVLDNAENLSDADDLNFYCLLGAYRAASDALLDFADHTATINWQPWHQERFA